MINKLKWVYGTTLVALSIGLLGLLTGCLSDFPEEGTNDSETSRLVEEIIFELGQEDQNYMEFRRRGFRGRPEYRCRVGVDCSTEAFPVYLYVAPIDEYVDDGVERITISFKLDQT